MPTPTDPAKLTPARKTVRVSPGSSFRLVVQRLRRGVGDQANWLQLVRFVVVGVSGYVVNLGVFAVCTQTAGVDYRVAACVSFVVAVSNNYFWHRHWTFDARGTSKRKQGLRFLSVSLAAFVTSLFVLQGLVDLLGLPEVPAQAVALALVVPQSFVLNKMWSFRQ